MLSMPEWCQAVGRTRWRRRATVWLLTAWSLSATACGSSSYVPGVPEGSTDSGGSQDVEAGFVDATLDSGLAQDALETGPDAGGEDSGDSGDGGDGGDSGDGATAADADAGVCIPHQGPPVLNPAGLPACSCPGAHCLATSLVPSAAASLLAACDSMSECVPDLFIASGGSFISPTCTSIAGAEGRCLSKCIPSVQAQAAQLPQSTCATGDVCVPCYDPVSGKSSGACNLSCDPGPQKPPTTLPKCCGDKGVCVPSSSVPQAQRSQLAVDGCPADSNNYLCAPNELTMSGGFTPPTCASLDNGEGRCLSTCLPSVAAQASTLPQSTCAAAYRCVPCYDPITGADTQACHISNDPGPQRPAVTFPKCCSGSGTCLPSVIVPDAEKSQLAANTCPVDSNQFLCAPTEFTAAGGFTPPTCRSVANAEGRCLSSCLPAIASQASQLPASTCSTGHLCAPCYDPLTGADTKVCRISNDPGPQEPPFTFPSCCTSRGVCVPMSLVPTAQQSQLGQDTCPNGQNYLCVAPRDFATNTSYKPPSCTGLFLLVPYTGVCLPACLPALSGTQGLLIPQGTCTLSTDKCIPCVNPVTLQATGACN
jgi:hypothetical protein